MSSAFDAAERSGHCPQPNLSMLNFGRRLPVGLTVNGFKAAVDHIGEMSR
jgi:hypothetical protein